MRSELGHGDPSDGVQPGAHLRLLPGECLPSGQLSSCLWLPQHVSKRDAGVTSSILHCCKEEGPQCGAS